MVSKSNTQLHLHVMAKKESILSNWVELPVRDWLSLVHTSDISISIYKINTKTKHDFFSRTCEDKTTRIFLYFAFCSALGVCLDYDLMLNTGELNCFESLTFI